MNYHKDTVLIIGGCGFVGSNLAARLMRNNINVRILDSFARSGSEINRGWLRTLDAPGGLEIIAGDVRDAELVKQCVEGVQAIYHFAAQVAVTTSVTDPRTDLEINILGTFNVLEAARMQPVKPLVVFTSTNKVYGSTDNVQVVEGETRYHYKDMELGISEQQPLDFHSPYGCSKGSADQYVIDYNRIYEVPTVVVRMSCIYGPRQFGNEDQGWVAHFLIQALEGKGLSIFGDGKQVRDILFVDDLMNLFEIILSKKATIGGQVFNVGGGKDNTISIWREFGPIIESLTQRPVPVTYGDWRPGDQRVYISDISKAKRELGWEPQFSVEQGVQKLHQWLVSRRSGNSLTAQPNLQERLVTAGALTL